MHVEVLLPDLSSLMGDDLTNFESVSKGSYDVSIL
jgi:hypothetical protein